MRTFWAMEIPKTSKIPTTQLSDNPATVGKELRKYFGTSTREQLEWRSPWMALRRWRQALESRNILVFQGGLPAWGSSWFLAVGWASICYHSIFWRPSVCTFLYVISRTWPFVIERRGVCITDLAYSTGNSTRTRNEADCPALQLTLRFATSPSSLLLASR